MTTLFLSFVNLFTHREGDTIDSNIIFMKNAFYKIPFAKYHQTTCCHSCIQTKLIVLSICILVFYNSLTMKQRSTKSKVQLKASYEIMR